MNVGILGSGAVAQALGAGFLRHGHGVLLGTRDTSKLTVWQRAHAGARLGSLADAAKFGELVVLAVKGTAAEGIVRGIAPALAHKPVIDTTNPIADAPPVDGVLRFFTEPNDSLMERLQKAAPDARFVKAFSCVGNALMVHPQLPGGPPTMFVCGADAAAKRVVADVLDRFGWEVEDLGSPAAARAIEPLCILWCIPGFRQNRWTHALKLLSR